MGTSEGFELGTVEGKSNSDTVFFEKQQKIYFSMGE